MSIALAGTHGPDARPRAGQRADDRRANHIVAELVSPGPIAPGSSALLAIHMAPQPGWHGYWLNPGDAGLGMQLGWSLPAAVTTGTPRYPVPQTLVVGGLMNHVYESAYAVMVPVTIAADATPGTVLPISVKAQWLACTESLCVPERALLTARITVAPAGSPAPVSSSDEQRWVQRLPAPLDQTALMSVSGATLRLAIPLPASVPLNAPHVFIAQDKAGGLRRAAKLCPKWRYAAGNAATGQVRRGHAHRA